MSIKMSCSMHSLLVYWESAVVSTSWTCNYHQLGAGQEAGTRWASSPKKPTSLEWMDPDDSTGPILGGSNLIQIHGHFVSCDFALKMRALFGLTREANPYHVLNVSCSCWGEGIPSFFPRHFMGL